MTRPVFFSMGGNHDADFAKSVKALLPDQMVYFYKRTGEESVAFRAEIEAEIQNCRLFVVFWSQDYLMSVHACNELAQFRRLAEGQGHTEKDVLVVPVGDELLDIQSKWTNPITSKVEEYVLGKWRFDRALDTAPDAAKVAEHVRRKLEKAQLMDQVLVSRPSILEIIKQAVSLPNYQAREFVFLSGYEGDGRRTALRQYMRSSYGNLTERQVAFDSAEGAEDLLLRVLDAAGVGSASRNEVMRTIQTGVSSATKELRKHIYSARESKSYYVVTMDRFSGVDAVGIPRWVSDVFDQFGAGNAPLVFLVTSNPVTDALLAHYPKAGRARLPGLDENEIAELVYRLSLEDAVPRRWSEQKKQRVCVASGSSPSLCKSIMRCMSTEPSLDFLDTIAKREGDSFASNMSALLAHLVRQLSHRENDILALRVVERLGLTSKRALDEIMEPLCQNGSYDLYLLREYGLVEQLSDDVYRIPPLIQRRLGVLLWGETQHKPLDALFAQFGKKMMIATDDYGAVYASNKVITGLQSTDTVSPGLEHYLTIATLFKVGLERYSNGQYPNSRAILARAMSRLKSGSTIDMATQVEIARYFGLASARGLDAAGVKSACDFLEDRFVKTSREQQAKAMAAFLRGFRARLSGEFNDAVAAFETARWLLKDVRGNERQRGAILTELSAAYLRKNPPNFRLALEAANQAYTQKQIIHTHNGLIRARIFCAFYDESFSDIETFKLEVEAIRTEIETLEKACKQTNQDFHYMRAADLERALAFRRLKDARLRGQDHVFDLSAAIALVEKALTQNPRDQTKVELWNFKIFDKSRDHSQSLSEETKKVLDRSSDHNLVYLNHAAKICILATDSADRQGARNLFTKYQKHLLPNTWGNTDLILDFRCILL